MYFYLRDIEYNLEAKWLSFLLVKKIKILCNWLPLEIDHSNSGVIHRVCKKYISFSTKEPVDTQNLLVLTKLIIWMCDMDWSIHRAQYNSLATYLLQNDNDILPFHIFYPCVTAIFYRGIHVWLEQHDAWYNTWSFLMQSFFSVHVHVLF